MSNLLPVTAPTTIATISTPALPAITVRRALPRLGAPADPGETGPRRTARADRRDGPLQRRGQLLDVHFARLLGAASRAVPARVLLAHRCSSMRTRRASIPREPYAFTEPIDRPRALAT